MVLSRLLLQCYIPFILTSSIHSFSTQSSSTRRDVLEQIKNLSISPFTTSVLQSNVNVANAVEESTNTPIEASWKAVDGLNSSEEGKFVSFDKSAYEAMMKDQSRTPLFEKAIKDRLKSAEGGPSSQIVLDLGTGPFALFAIVAAKAGAKKVYAIEASKDAAKSARETIKKLGYSDKIEVLEGFSTDITLPEQADVCIAEIVGSVCSEEGAYATILDAHKRLVKNPTDEKNWIPSRIQTYGAPASYTLHHLFRPPGFDWNKLDGEPVRFNCRDEGLQLLSDPVLVEDISFANIETEALQKKKQVAFTVDEKRIEENNKKFLEEMKRGRVVDAEGNAQTAANSVTGIALWPRLLLSDDVEINSRHFPDGGHQKSHWQTVLPIMSTEPVAVKGGDQIDVSFEFNVGEEVTKPSTYKISGNVISV